MDLSIALLVLGSVLLFCVVVGFTVCFCFSVVAKRDKAAALEAEKEKTNRILKVEEQKTERARLSNEKTAIYARRDLVNAEIEAGLLGRKEEEPEEEQGLDIGQIASMVLPIIQKNPEILGSFLGRGNADSASSQNTEGVDESTPSFPSV